MNEVVCAGRERAEDEGDGPFRIVSVGAPAGGDVADAGPVAQAVHRIALQRHDRWPVSDMDHAGILPEGHVVKAAKLVGQTETDEFVPLPPRAAA